MRTVTTCAVAVLALGWFAPQATAQAERYELGQRLRQFEEAWERQPDPAARKRALAILPDLTGQFFTLRLGEAGRTLDNARFALRSADPPSDAERWLTALYAVPERRLVDAAAKELAVEVRAFYPVKGGPPAGATALIQFCQRPQVSIPLDKLPAKVSVPFGEGEFAQEDCLWLQTFRNVDEVTSRTIPVTTWAGLDLKAAVLRPPVGPDREPFTSRAGIEIATLRDRAEMFARLAAGDSPETDFPVRHWGERAAVVNVGAWFGGRYFTADRSGGFWLSIPTGSGRRTPCGLLVPEGLTAGKSVPVVVALHGAGGSENLFFEGYGAGYTVRECMDRGWLLVTPRSELGFLGGPPPVPAILDKLAERYPIDSKRVFLVGHSMGAAQAVELVQQNPGRFAAVAALGGTGRVRTPQAFADLPVFVGVGSNDSIANGGAKALAKTLTAGGAKRVTFKEYPDLEHLVIVRESLPDVFELFDTVAGR